MLIFQPKIYSTFEIKTVSRGLKKWTINWPKKWTMHTHSSLAIWSSHKQL